MSFIQPIPDNDFFNIQSPEQCNEYCLEIFQYQFQHNELYRKFAGLLRKTPGNVKSINDIPFIPVSFFKNHTVISGEDQPTHIFTSSGTSTGNTSYHYVTDIQVYEQSFRRSFQLFYGEVTSYALLALLPSYLEREGSSLLYMIDSLMSESKHPSNGYFLYDHQSLFDRLNYLKSKAQPTILIGVSFALLDFAEAFAINWPDLIVMETGGMKGRRKEIIREELHHIISSAFGINSVHSEYGMTELLSQAYSKGGGIYYPPPWMKILIRDTNDPASYLPEGKTGGINIIDLANINSCSFIATDDLGKLNKDGSFEVLGRFGFSDIRGCNLMIGS